ncbi:MAG: acylphosphatase [Nocardioidaceae bacterium]
MSEPVIRRRVLVHGRVQGVFFRDGCRERAQSTGVHGWVANRPDGSLEAVFEGLTTDVDALVAWCREGPPEADVSGVEVVDETAQGLERFEVRG